MSKKYKDLDLESFTSLVQSFVGYDENAWSEIQAKDEQDDGESNFAKRLITVSPRSNILSQFSPVSLNSTAVLWRTQRVLDAGMTSGYEPDGVLTVVRS